MLMRILKIRKTLKPPKRGAEGGLERQEDLIFENSRSTTCSACRPARAARALGTHRRSLGLNGK